MGATADAVKVSYADLAELPDDGKRHELVDGEHAVARAPTPRHQRVLGRLFAAVHNFLVDHPVAEVLPAPVDVLLSEHDVVQPDLVLIAAERRGVVAEKHIAGAPDLVVEVISEGTRRRDEAVKRQLYARFGVREYWVVDPELETVRVLCLEGGAYREAVLLAREAGDVLRTEQLAGLEVPFERVVG